ncbi:MAG: PKD domain-containing protein, partial [Bacteroidota bacterium]
VSFDASTSSDQDGDELTFRWDLGDGNTAFGEKINHIYTTAASYTVRLTVDDGEGQNTTSQIIEVLEVPNKPPTADFTASTTSGEAPLPVRFDASASSDEDGDELSFQWDFGDGNTATGEKVDHLYQSAGSYTVTLLVSDQEDEASSSLSIVVSEPSNYVIIDGTYSIYNPLKGQNAVNPAWDNLNVRLFSSLVIFDDHKWTFEHIGQGKHRIQNVESKQFLSAASNACAEGVNLFSSANINADNGLWFIEAVGDKYLLRPAFCDDFVLASRAGAPNISLLPLDVDDALQQWELISVDQPDSRIEVNGSFFLQSKVNDLHAIAAEGSLQVEMAPSANPSNRHLWVFERIGRFRHTIRNVQTNNYLFVENGECGNGYSVLSAEKLDGNNGIWYVAKRGEDIYLIPAYCTSRVMDLMANATGAQIETYDITDVNQHWELIPQSVQPNQPPVAAFTSSTTNGEAPLPVRFDASTSTDADGDALTFQWAFGDGNTATGETVNHAYQSAGTYTVTLTVSDQQDQSTASQTIVVEEPANYLIIDGTYSIHNSARGQNAVNPAWDNLNVRLFSSLVIFDDHKWTFEHVGQGKHTIVNRESNQFLSAETADCEDGINLYSSSAPEAENGLWYIEAVGQQFLLRPTFCRDYVLGFRSNSPNISLIPFDASDAFQQWELISVDQPDSRIEINGSFFIQSKANDLQAIAASGGLEVAMAPENAIAGKHKWLFESIGRFKHTIRNLETGNYLFVENGGCSNGFSILSSPDVVRSNGVWYVAKKGDDFYLIPAYCTSRVMDQMDDASASQIETYDIADVNQRWALINAGGSTQFRASHFVNELTATPIFGKKSELSYYTYQNDARPVHRYTFQHMMEEDEDFVDIGVINANDQYGAQRINYVHDKAKVGRNYYRVKVEYADGTVSYSPFRMVSFETGLDQLKISIAPNPTQEVLNVDLSNFMDKPIHYFISSLSGKVVMHGQFSKDHGEVEVVRLSEVKNGDYIIYLRPESHREIPIQFVILKNY